MSNFTPGPWEYVRGRHSPRSKDRRCFWAINQAGDARGDLPPRICDVIAPAGMTGFREGQDTARLIASAPDMLDELNSASERVQQARLDLEAGDLEGVHLGLEAMLQEIASAIAKATGSAVPSC